MRERFELSTFRVSDEDSKPTELPHYIQDTICNIALPLSYFSNMDEKVGIEPIEDVLPSFAVCVFLFLMYILYNIFFKNQLKSFNSLAPRVRFELTDRFRPAVFKTVPPPH